jgi:hypothetical protein
MLPFSSKMGMTVDPKGFLTSYFFAEDLCMLLQQELPDGDGYFTIQRQIFI